MTRLITSSLLLALCITASWLVPPDAQAKPLRQLSNEAGLSVAQDAYLLLAKKDGRDDRGRWDKMSERDRDKLRKRREKYESMSPKEKDRIRRARERYERLPPQQREQLRKKWEEMTPEERRRYRLEERKYR